MCVATIRHISVTPRGQCNVGSLKKGAFISKDDDDDDGCAY